MQIKWIKKIKIEIKVLISLQNDFCLKSQIFKHVLNYLIIISFRFPYWSDGILVSNDIINPMQVT